MFNEVFINRPNPTTDIINTIKVPLSYSPKEKMLARIDGDPNLARPAIVLPRMGFELTSINYAPERKLNTLQKNLAVSTTDKDILKYQYIQVPYDFIDI